MAAKGAGTVVTTVGRAVGAHRRELVWLVSIVVWLFAGIALAGRDPTDPNVWSRPDVVGDRVTRNPAGWLGATTADMLYVTFGVSAWVVVLSALVVSMALLARRSVGGASRVVAFVIALVAAMGALGRTLSPVEGDPAHPAGTVGLLVESVVFGPAGAVGGWLVLVSVWAMCATLLFSISWGEVASRAWERAEAEWPRAREAARAAGGTFGAWGRVVVIAIGRALLAMLVAIGRWVLSWTRRGGDFAVDVAQGTWVALTRRPGEQFDDPAWTARVQERRGDNALGTPDMALLDPVRGDTEVRAETDAAPSTAPVAEVGWDPTRAATVAGAAVDDVLDLFPTFVAREVERGAEPAVETSPAPQVRRVARPASTQPTGASREPSSAPFVPSLPEEPMPPEEPMSAPLAAPPAHHAAMVGLEPSVGVDDDAMGEVTHHERPKVEAAEGLRRAPTRDDGRAVSDRPSLYFELPPLSLLEQVPEQRAEFDEDELAALATSVEASLASFRVTGRVTNVRVGPVVTTFEFLPDAGISVRKVAGLTDDLAMALCAQSVRVLAPIPGKGVVGIEVPNETRLMISLREMLASKEFRKAGGSLPVVIGKDVEGRAVVTDLAKMPHLLIGGTTGSGKSVGVNVLLLSMLFTKTPDELRLLLVDPKQLEFSAYADIPHLLHPVVKKADDAAVVLDWACREMDRRYKLLSEWNARNLSNFNKKLERELRDWNAEKAWRYAPDGWDRDDPPPPPEPMPYIVIVIDELADLMMVAKKDVETSIVRLAQLARACGMHLIVATQRPSVDVVTGLIKSNMPTRIAFQLRSVTDSRTVLDSGGADKLLGKGDMLMLPNDGGDLKRVHGPFVDDDEVLRVVDFLKRQGKPRYLAEIGRAAEAGGFDAPSGLDGDEVDDLYDDAVRVVLDKGKASTSMIQRHLKIGYNRAARIIDQMEAAGLVGPADGARPREVLPDHERL